jgi:hypothetical protein
MSTKAHSIAGDPVSIKTRKSIQKIPHPVLYTRTYTNTYSTYVDRHCMSMFAAWDHLLLFQCMGTGPILEIRAHVMVYGIPLAAIWGSRPVCTEVSLATNSGSQEGCEVSLSAIRHSHRHARFLLPQSVVP